MFFENPRFKEMSTAEAKEFLSRYLGETERNLDLLWSDLSAGSARWSSSLLDFTPESLVPVWEFFLDRFQTEDKTEAEIEAMPEWVRNSAPRVKFSSDTRRRIIWISFYFAEVVLRNIPKVKWGIGRSGQFKNQPVILGFRHVFDLSPLTLVEEKAWGVVQGKSSADALLRAYQFWAAKAPR
jgi:hypothetical protein